MLSVLKYTRIITSCSFFRPLNCTSHSSTRRLLISVNSVSSYGHFVRRKWVIYNLCLFLFTNRRKHPTKYSKHHFFLVDKAVRLCVLFSHQKSLSLQCKQNNRWLVMKYTAAQKLPLRTFYIAHFFIYFKNVFYFYLIVCMALACSKWHMIAFETRYDVYTQKCIWERNDHPTQFVCDCFTVDHSVQITHACMHNLREGL